MTLKCARLGNVLIESWSSTMPTGKALAVVKLRNRGLTYSILSFISSQQLHDSFNHDDDVSTVVMEAEKDGRKKNDSALLAVE